MLSLEIQKQVDDLHRDVDVVAALSSAVTKMIETHIETSDGYDNVRDLENSGEFKNFVDGVLEPALRIEMQELLDVAISEAYTQVVQHHENSKW